MLSIFFIFTRLKMKKIPPPQYKQPYLSKNCLPKYKRLNS